MSTKNPPKYIILIWESPPEDSDIYLIPREDISKKDVRMLARCHDNHIHGSSLNYHNGKHTRDEIVHSLGVLSEMLCSPDNTWVKDRYKIDRAGVLKITTSELDKILGSWVKYKIRLESPQILPRARFIRCGANIF